MIVVAGASGNVGREVVAALRERGAPVRGLVRDPARASAPPGVELAAADLELPESLPPALDGAEAVFLLGGFSDMPGIVRRVDESGARRAVLLTSRCVIGGRPDNAVTAMWNDAEAAVAGSALEWTILRPSGFHSNALRWLPQLRHGNVVRAPWPDVPIAAIDPADIGAVAAVALTTPGHEGTALELSGPEPLTPADQVAVLAAALDRPLAYEPVDDETARAEMEADTPKPFVDAFFRFFSEGEYDDARVVDTVERVLGRPPRRFAEWAAAHAADFRAVA